MQMHEQQDPAHAASDAIRIDGRPDWRHAHQGRNEIETAFTIAHANAPQRPGV
jgi:hypothetical protein